MLCRIVFALLLLLPGVARAGDGPEIETRVRAVFDGWKSTETLLDMALQPVTGGDATEKAVRDKAYQLLAQRAADAEEAAIIEPRVGEIVADYDRDKQDDRKRERIARLLLTLKAAGERQPEMVFAILKEIDLAQPYPQLQQAREAEAVGWVRELAFQPRHAPTILYGLTVLMQKKFYSSVQVMEAALTVIDGYKSVRTAAQTERLLRALDRLETLWADQKKREEQDSAAVTIWDYATEADLIALRQHMQKTICAKSPKARYGALDCAVLLESKR